MSVAIDTNRLSSSALAATLYLRSSHDSAGKRSELSKFGSSSGSNNPERGRLAFKQRWTTEQPDRPAKHPTGGSGCFSRGDDVIDRYLKDIGQLAKGVHRPAVASRLDLDDLHSVDTRGVR